MGMENDSREGPFRLERCGDLTLLRRALEEKGYTQQAVADLVDPSRPPNPLETVLDVAAVLRRTAGSSPLDTLIRLFVLARPVPEEAAQAALAPIDLEHLAAIGLLKRDGQEVHAEAALLPFADLLLARDFWPAVTGKPRAADYVLGVGPATIAVANLTVRRKGEAVLDLGTGAGFLALVAAEHADRVVGTDVNLRALGIASFNARLNGAANVEFRPGSLFEPVRDGRFDLIVSNPPFVISPGRTYAYRDGGMSGDAFSEQVIRQVPAFLREGGYSTVLFNWHHKSEADWAERPIAWLDSSGCDAWLLCSEHADPIGYASNWLKDVATAEAPGYDRLLDEWLAYYERLGIGRISAGAVILRRRSGGRNWIRCERAPPGGATGSASDQIQRVFAAEDLLHRLADDRELLQTSLALTPDHQLQQVLHADQGRWSVERIELRQTRGFPFTGEVDRLTAKLLLGCDGGRPLGELVAQVAPQSESDPDQFARAAAALIRKLLKAGFLTAAGPAQAPNPASGRS